MIKTLVTAGAYTSGPIPLTNYINTNTKYDLVNNAIEVKMSGLSNVIANVDVTATADGALSLQMYVDGVAVPGALDSKTLANGSTYSFHINDVIKTVHQLNPTFAKITFVLSGACTIVGGDAIVEYAR